MVEFDAGDALRDQCAVLSSLSSPAAPLVMAVWSGGKSIHGWFDVSALRRSDKRRFFQFARLLGADNALWNTAALVRMPGGVRDNGARQSVCYFRPQGEKGNSTPTISSPGARQLPRSWHGRTGSSASPNRSPP